MARGTPVRMGGLEGHAHDPVAVPQALHAFALFVKPGAGVAPALQPLAGYHGEYRPDESTRYGSGPAQDGGSPRARPPTIPTHTSIAPTKAVKKRSISSSTTEDSVGKASLEQARLEHSCCGGSL